jgi:hypothetical protein
MEQTPNCCCGWRLAAAGKEMLWYGGEPGNQRNHDAGVELNQALEIRAATERCERLI